MYLFLYVCKDSRVQFLYHSPIVLVYSSVSYMHNVSTPQACTKCETHKTSTKTKNIMFWYVRIRHGIRTTRDASSTSSPYLDFATFGKNLRDTCMRKGVSSSDSAVIPTESHIL